ncbi:hypothetical protein AB0A74_03085 [Saccharothrix sp. NPDC042600]|uniref:hypothetical protein n=1 Tax=Saccharothrix TaxID=2071 RepID=UPI0033D7E6A9|nr:hypothetical protein GCM10017745_67610 [Saccharothrix mutabilis subsp. capreolus]
MTLTRDNNVVFRAVMGEILAHLRLACEVALDGDDRAAASVARRELPGLVTGLQELLAGHEPDHNGHCRRCRAWWWRRKPVPCREVLAFRRALLGQPVTRAKHRLRSEDQHSR